LLSAAHQSKTTYKIALQSGLYLALKPMSCACENRAVFAEHRLS